MPRPRPWRKPRPEPRPCSQAAVRPRARLTLVGDIARMDLPRDFEYSLVRRLSQNAVRQKLPRAVSHLSVVGWCGVPCPKKYRGCLPLLPARVRGRGLPARWARLHQFCRPGRRRRPLAGHETVGRRVGPGGLLLSLPFRLSQPVTRQAQASFASHVSDRPLLLLREGSSWPGAGLQRGGLSPGHPLSQGW